MVEETRSVVTMHTMILMRVLVKSFLLSCNLLGMIRNTFFTVGIKKFNISL